MKTMVSIYRNKYNLKKFIDVRNDGYYHNSIRQFSIIQHGENIGKFNKYNNKLVRMRKQILKNILEDYDLVYVGISYKDINAFYKIK